MKTAPRSLVLITVDCLRADRVAASRSQRQITPFLDSLADESFVFRNAYASGIPTYYSLPALMASRYPLALGRDVIGIAPGERTIATELQDCGLQTAAFVAGNPYICSAHGYDAGFTVFRHFLSDSEIESADDDGLSPDLPMRARANRALSHACHSLPGVGAAYDELYFRYCQNVSRQTAGTLDSLRMFPSADVIVDCAIAWLCANSTKPFFLWLHLMDPHAPYYPTVDALQEPAECITAAEARYLNSFWAREDLSFRRLQKKCEAIQALYDAGVRWADQQIERLAKKLVELNLWNQTVVAVTADHGEEFLDHGGRFHRPNNLHEELIRVPLQVRVPGHGPGREVNHPLGLIDLSPTLLDVLKIPAPGSFRGHSCWQELATGEAWNRPVFTECVRGCSNPFCAEKRLAPRLLAVRKGEYKFVIDFATGTDELFELSSDPGEAHPLRSASDARRRLMECAKKHIAEGHNTRNLDLRLAAQARELRAEWAQTSASRPN